MSFRIGRYEIERELGHGGFGDVYLAYDPEVDWKVAIKILNDPERLKYFELEAVVSGKLQHKNIVTIHDRGIDQSGKPYLVMELLEGQTLKEVIKNGGVSLLQQVDIMTQVAEGLEYAHSKGVVHRDIKPENIMVLPDFTAKIMDFGIALAPSVQTEVTEGRWAGSPKYQAPEQLPPSYSKANEQTDIFSYGVVYYELLTGRHPFKEILGPDYQREIWSYRPDPVSKWAPNCPASLELLVDNAIAVHPHHRYRKSRQIVLDSQGILEPLKSERALILLAEARQMQREGQLGQARETAERARRLDPRNRDAFDLHLALEQELEKGEGRIRAAELLRQASLRMAERHFQEAVNLLESAAQLDCGNQAIEIRLAEARTRRANSVRAHELFEASRSSERKGLLGEALAQVRDALRIDPDHTEAKRQMARITGSLEEQERGKDEEIQDQTPRTPTGKPSSESLAVSRQSERLQLGLDRTREAIDAGELERAGQMIMYLRANFADHPRAAVAISDLEARWKSRQHMQEAAGSLYEQLSPTQKIHIDGSMARASGLFLWKYLVTGAALILLVSSAVVAWILHKPAPTPISSALIPVEIRTDPPAALVRLGDRSCVSPNCRLTLSPGSYQVVVQMAGYEPDRRTLVVEAGKQMPPLDITLQPVKPASEPKPDSTNIAYLVVQVGIPDALVLIDDVPTARTGQNGTIRLPIAARQHRIRVQKFGYREEPEQRFDIRDGAIHTAKFSLVPDRAKLVFLGAPPEVEVYLKGLLLGRTDGSAEYVFSQTVPPGSQVLQMKFQAAVQPISERFEAGQTLRVDWRSIAPPPKPALPPVKADVPENTERKAWEEALNSADPVKLQAFIDEHRNSTYRSDALLKLDEVFWTRTNKDDVSSLQTYVRSFPLGRYLRNASTRIDDLLWTSVNKANIDELKKFVGENSGSTHRSEAQALINKLASPASVTQPQPKSSEVDKAGILNALNLLEKAYEERDLGLVKKVFPNADTRISQSFAEMREYHYGLQPQEPVIDGDSATVHCARAVSAVPAKGRALPTTRDNVVIILRKIQGRWLINSIERTP